MNALCLMRDWQMSSSTPRWTVFLAFFVSSSLASAAQGNVFVVDRYGPGPLKEIREAVALAQDGDTILVRIPVASHTYAAVDIAGKALTIVADSNAVPVRVQALRVRDLPAGKTVLLSRLACAPRGFGQPLGTPMVRLESNSGNVRFVSCSSVGEYARPVPSMEVRSSNGSTALASCSVVGGLGEQGDEFDGGPGGPGLLLRDSVAIAYDSTITGGEGGLVWLGSAAGDGGPGALVQRESSPARLLLAGSAIRGGRGGEIPWCAYTRESGPGGDEIGRAHV